MKAERQAWAQGMPELDGEKLVFIDETWARTDMTRTRGRCPRGERLLMAVPAGHWKTTTFVGALRSGGVFAPMVVDGAVNGDLFEAYVGQVLVPELREGEVVVMDNLSSHKRGRVRELIEGAKCRLLFLPPYSPDYNPIQMAFSKLKALLRAAERRTVEGLWQFLGEAVDAFSAEECANYIRHCGYEGLPDATPLPKVL